MAENPKTHQRKGSWVDAPEKKETLHPEDKSQNKEAFNKRVDTSTHVDSVYVITQTQQEFHFKQKK